MKHTPTVILLCCSLWMTIYLYGEYAVHSAKYHPFFITFPVALFIYAVFLFLQSLDGLAEGRNHRTDD